MRIRIRHTIRYDYSAPVVLDPSFVRLRPRSDGSQELLAFRLDVDPDPAGRAPALDADGNAVVALWFEGSHDRFEVRVESVVDTRRSNPFGFVLARWHDLPVPAEDLPSPALELAARPRHEDARIDDLVRPLLKETDRRTVDFLVRLNETIPRLIEGRSREHGPPLPPAETLERGQGACRDQAVLFIEACRSLGLPARFVSGYHHHGDPEGPFELHGWAEVYLPGAGWRGFDPSAGLLAADRHVPVASAVEHAGAAPVAGRWRGTNVTSSIDFRVELESVDPDAAPTVTPDANADVAGTSTPRGTSNRP